MGYYLKADPNEENEASNKKLWWAGGGIAALAELWSVWRLGHNI
jgi:hypothetical protein